MTNLGGFEKSYKDPLPLTKGIGPWEAGRGASKTFIWLVYCRIYQLGSPLATCFDAVAEIRSELIKQIKPMSLWNHLLGRLMEKYFTSSFSCLDLGLVFRYFCSNATLRTTIVPRKGSNFDTNRGTDIGKKHELCQGSDHFLVTQDALKMRPSG